MEREDTISLQDYLVVLKRQRWVVLTTAVLVVVAGVGVSFAQTPIYESEVEVVVEPVRRTQDVSLEELLLPQASAVNTERLVVTSRPVADRVVAELGLPNAQTAVNRIRVETVADTRVVRIVASDPDPVAAANTADAFGEAYLDFRRDQAVEGLLAARGNLEARADSLRAEIDALNEDDDADEVQRDALLSQLSSVVAQTAELGDAAGTVSGGGAILTPAEIATSPVSPRPIRTGALAVALGLLLGVGLAFLRDHIDDVIRDENDFKRATGDRPILGRIPTWSDPDGGDRLATVVEPTSLASESYRELSAGVRFLLLAHQDRHQETEEHRLNRRADDPDHVPGRSIMMCSASAGDGKTSTAANLAVAAARVGLRTLLVDADLRRSTVGQRFGLARVRGLSDLLLSGTSLRDHVQDVGIDNLLVLPAGTIPPNPNELLASPAMRVLEREILANVDVVIYDTPAVLAVPDALELGRHVDVAIMVGRAGSTGRRQLSAAVERLEQVGTEVAGAVLNDINARTDGYYYSYYYAEDEQRDSKGRSDKAKAPRAKASKGAGSPARHDPHWIGMVPAPRDTPGDGSWRSGTSDGSVAPDDGSPTSLFGRRTTEQEPDADPLFGRHD